jgi:hypothetical protein
MSEGVLPIKDTNSLWLAIDKQRAVAPYGVGIPRFPSFPDATDSRDILLYIINRPMGKTTP